MANPSALHTPFTPSLSLILPPQQLGMEDMDTLDVFLAQVGGGWW
jgi:hypothetical protein